MYRRYHSDNLDRPMLCDGAASAKGKIGLADHGMQSEMSASLRPRPVRVAFLVQDDEHSQLRLDGIFADCYSRWGGRFSLIVPCENNKIGCAYWRWLEAYDPDIIYSYVSLSDDDIIAAHERLYLAEFLQHSVGVARPPLRWFDFKPQYHLNLLPSMSVIFRRARQPALLQPALPLRIIDSHISEQNTRFLTDNFGTYSNSVSGLYPADATAAATLLVIATSEDAISGPYRLPVASERIESEIAAFAEFANGRAASMSELSLVLAPKLDIRSNRWSSSFNLVIGDTFADRIIYWNGRLLIPSWLDTEVCCLRVTLDHLESPDFMKALIDFLTRRNHVNAGAGGQSQLTVRSASLDPVGLDRATAIIRTGRAWFAPRTERVASLDELVPSQRELNDARESNRFGRSFYQPPEWTRFVWSPPAVRPPPIFPDHLTDVPARRHFSYGFWCTDFILRYPELYSAPHSQAEWRLPRRWRMAGAFGINWVGGHSHGRPPEPRGTRGGRLAVFVDLDHPIESIQIPEAKSAFAYALTMDGSQVNFSTGKELTVPPRKAAWTRPSNEARYLTGVLGLMDGLQTARVCLLHPFLQGIFASLGATPILPMERVQPSINRLRKISINRPNFDLRSERERTALGRLIVQAVGSISRPREFVTLEHLQSKWQEHRDAYWTENQKPTPHHGTDGDCDQLEARSLDDALIWMRGRQILFQGYQWLCDNCHHRNWADFSSLASELECGICKRVISTPVNIKWQFRANEFLIDSLRDHSVLSLIWLLTRLVDRTRHSFIYVGPTWFWFNRPDDEEKKPEAEADLLAVADGKCYLCEAKVTWNALRLSDISDLVQLATRLRPDVAVLAVMETGNGPVKELENAKERLAAQDIHFEVITPTSRTIDDGPYLHF